MDTPSSRAEVYVTDSSVRRPSRKLTDTNPQADELRARRDRSRHLEEQRRHGGRRRAAQAGGLRSRARSIRCSSSRTAGRPGAFYNNYRVGGLEGGQLWAGQGWAVFYPNPRGSTNYGEKFLQANINDWGGGDYRDIMTGVDALIARGIADPDRLAHIGWSYGGYMTAWVITQTNRFKAAMVGAGLTNMVSMYGTNDIPNVLTTYFGGIPEQGDAAALRRPFGDDASSTTSRRRR